jgi:hypothetical protein
MVLQEACSRLTSFDPDSNPLAPQGSALLHKVAGQKSRVPLRFPDAMGERKKIQTRLSPEWFPLGLS